MAAAQKKARDEGRTVVFIDETGYMLSPTVRRTWAPRGQTPVLTAWARHDRLSVIAALCVRPDGSCIRLYFRVRRGNFDGPAVVGFLKHLCRVVRTPMLLVWDRASIHRGEAVKEFLRTHPGRIHIEPLPGYAPDLNPVEHVWGQSKGWDLANFCPTDIDQLQRGAVGSLTGHRQRPSLLMSYFHQAGLYFDG